MAQDSVVRNVIQSIGERLFPGISETYKTDVKTLLHRGIGYEIQSSLPLQMSLYFNCFYFPIWSIVMATSCYLKYDQLGNFWKFVLVTALVSSAILESGRLILGYIGNLSEKVPELCSFWLLTFLLQLPLMILFTFQREGLPRPVELVSTLVNLVFIFTQLAASFFAIKNMSRYQAMLLRINKQL